MAPSANFHLPVVFENLRDPESLHQLLDSLEALDRVAEEVFGRITGRVQQQRSDLQGIQTRLSEAEANIAAVAARKGEGTTIYSPSKYPAAAQLADYSAVNVGGHDVRVLKRATFSLPPISAEEEEKERSAVEDSSLFEYSANGAPSTAVNTALEGLGKVPAHLASASSLLLFNSTQNPYKKYSALDTMVGDAAKEEVKEDEGPSAAAPTSVQTGEAYEGVGSSDISYQPGKAPLAQFNLAPTLNLPGAPVANNIAFSEEVSQIAPSVMMLANLDQLLLPDVASVPAPAASATTPAPPPPPPGEAAAAAPPPPPPPPAAAAPPPPPPPPPPAAAEAGNGPPPPPPPPAPPPPPPSGGASDDDSGGRAGLLDAIKNPQLGKNRLKGAVNKVVKAKKTAVVAGDFMSQMRDKMEARRAAMAGGPEDPAAGRASVASAASDEAEPEAKPQVASIAGLDKRMKAADEDDDSLSSASDWEESD